MTIAHDTLVWSFTCKYRNPIIIISAVLSKKKKYLSVNINYFLCIYAVLRKGLATQAWLL